MKINDFAPRNVTPEAKAYSEDVDMVTLPGSEGELGIYPQHVLS